MKHQHFHSDDLHFAYKTNWKINISIVITLILLASQLENQHIQNEMEKYRERAELGIIPPGLINLEGLRGFDRASI